MDSKQYWDQKIISWEDSMQSGKPVPMIERLAAHFRGPLIYRANLAVEQLAPIIRGKRVLELGCGSGFFAFNLMAKGSPAEYTGIDISPNAVARATTLAHEKGLDKQMTFMAGDVMSMSLPPADVVVGLGFLDYLTGEEIQTLFSRLDAKYIFFSFSERRPSLLRIIHQMYLLSQNCPKHFYYTKDEMRRFVAPKFPDMQFFSNAKLSFASIVHNLPKQ